MTSARSPWSAVLAAFSATVVIAASVLAGAAPASASPLTMSVTRGSSGTTAADTVGSLPASCAGITQGQPTPQTHCPGYDVSLSAADQIVRSYDTADVVYTFNVGASDTGVKIVSTLPADGNGNAIAKWPSFPSACASTGSSVSADGRTLTCLIGSLSGDGVLKLTFQVQPSAQDGSTFTVDGTIASATTTSPVGSSSTTATYTVSNAPLWNVTEGIGGWRNILPAPFPYYSATGEQGWAVPTSAVILPGKSPAVGGYSPLQGPVTYAIDTSNQPSGTRLLNWAEYGSGCGSQNLASATKFGNYRNLAVNVTNQGGPPQAAAVSCSQPAANQPVTVTWANPYMTPSINQPYANIWVMLWMPASSVPAGANTIPFKVTDFDPTDAYGASNYGAATEPTADNSRTFTITSADANVGFKRVTADANQTAGVTNNPAAITTVTRGSSAISWVNFKNTGSIPQDPVQVCDVFDSTTTKLTTFSGGAYVIGVTDGDPTLPALPPAYHPATGYNGTTNASIDPSAYTVQFAAGDVDMAGGTTNAPQDATKFIGAACADAGGATGWVSDPNDPAIAAFAQSRGLTDPFDVIGRVRVTFTAGAVMPGSNVGIKLRLAVRTNYRDATSKAGQLIPATTPISDAGGLNYPQATTTPWSKTIPLAPTVKIVGTLGSHVTIASKTVSPTTVQIATPGQDTATYTVTPRLYFGEDMPADPATPGNVTAPVRVVDYLPAGMRYLQGSASRDPDQVLVQPDGGTVIVWDLGTQSAKVNTANQLTSPATITYQAQAVTTAPLGTNYNGVIGQSIAPDGTSLDNTPLCGSASAWVSFPIPATTNVPVPTTATLMKPADYSGCAGQGVLGPYNYRALQIGSAAVQLVGSLSATAPQIEPNSVDGVAGGKVGWGLTYSNQTSITLGGVDLIDVLPNNADGRTPASRFSGTLKLTSVTTDDTLSPAGAPNALPTNPAGPYPARAGTTFYYTAAAAASVKNDPYDATNLASGSTKWCLQNQFGTAGCPADIGSATAVRVISGALAPSEKRNLGLGFATNGNKKGDLYSNTAYARAINVSSLSYVPGDSIQVVGSSIAGKVWKDVNGDGVVGGALEPGLAGVSLRITGTADDGSSVNRTVTTAADGSYTFSDLRAGSYDVAVDEASARALDPAYALTYDPQHHTTSPIGTFHVDLGLNATVVAQNVGFATASLSGTVFDDSDDDGALDTADGEKGENGATVALTGTDDLGKAVTATVTTDASGAFTFPGLRPGTYAVTVTPNPSTRLGGKITLGTSGGTAGAVGSNTVTGITLGAAQNASGYFFAELQPNLVSGAVFSDLDGDGTQDAGEPGIAGVTVTLTGTDDSGTVTPRTVVTLADGTWTFTGLRSGTYTVTEDQSTIPGGPTAFVDGVTRTNGASGAAGSNTISGITTGATNGTTGYSFAEIPAAGIAGVVYEDLNANGQQDAGEPGIGGVTVNVTGGLTQTTGPDGTYAFVGLAPGSYTLTETQPSGYLDGRELAGTAGGTVAPASGSNAISAVVLGPGVHVTGYQFGEVKAAQLSGAAFVDGNDNGTKDAGENGIGGVQVTLTGTDLFGAAVSLSATTAADGTYGFVGLLPGIYSVTEVQPAGYFDGKDAAGPAGGTVGADTVAGIVLGSGASAAGYTFGERSPVSIQGTVFSDLNGDGIIQTGEDGVAGVAIDLQDSGGATVGSTTTGASGAWSFTGIAPGVYSIHKTLPAGAQYVDGAVVVGTAGGTAQGSAITGIDLQQVATGYAFAEIPLSVIRGSVWHDADDDGVRDAGEDPIPGITITLGGDADRTTTTDADGRFVFGGLAAGTYTLTETQPGNWADGKVAVGRDGGASDAANTITGIPLAAGADADGYGFGERVADLQVLVKVQNTDASVAPGPNVAVGGDVKHTFTVVNNGDTALSDLELTQEGLTIDCPADPIPAHSVVECSATTPATAGAHTGTVTATAQVVPSGPAGQVADPGVGTLTSSADSHWFGMVAEAEVTARVNGTSAGTAPGPVFDSGTPEKVTITIANTGNVALTIVSVDGDSMGALTCPTALVAPGDSVDCTASSTFAAGNYSAAVKAHLRGPDAVAVDGATAPTTVEPRTTVWFQVLEAQVTRPATSTDLPGTGSSVNVSAIVLMATLLIAAGVGLEVWRRRRGVEA